MDDFKPFCLADNMARCPKPAVFFDLAGNFAMMRRREVPERNQT
jgi:hypothetical protein